MKEVYILATPQAEPVAEAAVREAFESDEVELKFGEDGCLFSVHADDTRVETSDTDRGRATPAARDDEEESAI